MQETSLRLFFQLAYRFSCTVGGSTVYLVSFTAQTRCADHSITIMHSNILSSMFILIVALQHSGRRCTTHTTALILREQENSGDVVLLLLPTTYVGPGSLPRRFESKMGYRYTF